MLPEGFACREHDKDYSAARKVFGKIGEGVGEVWAEQFQKLGVRSGLGNPLVVLVFALPPAPPVES